MPSFSYPDFSYNLATATTVDISNTFIPSTPPPNTKFFISPTLPSGLAINNTTGSIQGTTTFLSISSLITYTVDASYDTARIYTTLQISVNFTPGFSYPFTPYLLETTVNKTIIPVYFIGNLIGISYSLISSPPLTDISLNLNTTNGVISGTPLSISPSTIYTIRANNGGIIYDASLFISVETFPTLSYPQQTYILTQGVVVNITPTNAYSGQNISYSIDGCALPSGLVLNTQTGAIYGTPLLPTTFREYTISVTNLIGVATTKIIINVIKEILAPPIFSDNFNIMLTEPDIEMRRKAEILQYKQNSSNMSAQSKYSLMAQGKGPYAKRAWGNQGDRGTSPNISGLPQEGNTIICNSNPIICNPTSSSNVPGTIMRLCYNPAIPLYGYTQPNRTKVNIGFKWPQRSWMPDDSGFPVGKSGTDE